MLGVRCPLTYRYAGSIEALIARKLIHTLQRREIILRCKSSNTHDSADHPSGSEEGNDVAEELEELEQKVELVGG